MNTTPITQLLNGQIAPPPALIPLRAGPLTLHFVDGAVRTICCGEIEVLRQIYAAVRDQNWGTIPSRLADLRIETADDRFHITFESIHQQGEVDFRWQGRIEGESDGTITFHFSGRAQSQFRRNRIGFCILHPMVCAGLPVRIEQVDEQITAGSFPEFISPHQPFRDIRAIQHEFAPGAWVEVRMQGDTFEMEDQRNWTDASFKTYCTPLDQPFPVEVPTGTQIEQVVTLRILHRLQVAAGSTSTDNAPLTLRLQPESIPLPAIGLGAASHDEPLNQTAIARLHLSHLRIDVCPDQPDWAARLHRTTDEARRIGAPLEIALHLGEAAEDQLREVQQQVQQAKAVVAHWLIFRQGELTTLARWIELARRILGNSAPIIGGTDAFFAELNRNRPDYPVMDGLVYSINPQVHAFDDASLVETLAAQAATVQSARQFAGSKPIYVSPVTLKMRWNPNATAAPRPPAPDALPPQADPRQMSLFSAGWTLASIKHLASGGAASLTYYETTGYLGVMATKAGSALPDQFWDIPGGVYPIYQVLADVGEFAGGRLIPLSTSDALRVEGLALQDRDRFRILIANLTPQPQSVTLEVEGSFRLRTLDVANAEWAMREPEQYRAQPGLQIETSEGHLMLELAPFAVLTLDQLDRKT